MVAAAALFVGTPAMAGPIFLTGHDPDFHAQDSVGAQNLLRSGLNFVTGGTFDDGASTKFLWVESRIPTPSGHRIGENGLGAIGLTLGTNYDRVNAAEFATANLSNYTAIAIASGFGGLLTRAELDALIARSDDIANYVNAGGGLLALAECFPCGANLLGGATAPDLFGFLPVDVSAIAPSPPFTVTAEGAAAPFNLTNGDVNDPTHNSFGLIGGLTPLDRDQGNQATTLAGNVRIDGGGFCGTPDTPPCPTSVPAPAGIMLVASGLLGLGGLSWRRRRAAK
jgi:hypothetical protein